MVYDSLIGRWYRLGMTNPQMVSAVDRWLDRTIPPLLAAALIGGFLMWGDIRVIQRDVADLKEDREKAADLDASQNESLRQLNLRTTILERQNP